MLARLWYRYLQFWCRVYAVLCFRYRIRGLRHLPAAGGVLIVANHQSNLDPVLIGLPAGRLMNYLARETLFKFPPLAWLMRSLGAVPIDREGLSLEGLKESLRRLKQGGVLVVFPEGTRTRTGAIGRLKPGFSTLARRTKSPIVPVAIAGAFEAWPRSRPLPLPTPIHVEYGPPIMPDEFDRYDEPALIAEVTRRLHACHERAAAHRGRALHGER